MKVKYNLVSQFFIKRMFQYRGLCDCEISAPGVVILIKDLRTYISPITSQLCYMFVLFVKQRCCDFAEAAFAAVKCSVMRHTIRIAYTCLWWLAIPSVFGLNDEIAWRASWAYSKRNVSITSFGNAFQLEYVSVPVFMSFSIVE